MSEKCAICIVEVIRVQRGGIWVSTFGFILKVGNKDKDENTDSKIDLVS